MASHCPTDNFREKFVEALSQYIRVDSYGKCGKFPCPNARLGHDYCFDNLSANHSFYLAFENSNCPDYITEKFWRTLSKPVIPIVMGGGNYSKGKLQKIRLLEKRSQYLT